MAKKEEATKEQQVEGCGLLTCADGTCPACQVALAKRHHEDFRDAGKALVTAVRDVVNELTMLRNMILEVSVGPERIRNAARVAEAAPAQKAPEKPAAPAAEAPAKKLTADSVRPFLLSWVKANGRDKLVAALQKYGAGNLPELKEEHIPALVKDLGISIP